MYTCLLWWKIKRIFVQAARVDWNPIHSTIFIKHSDSMYIQLPLASWIECMCVCVCLCGQEEKYARALLIVLFLTSLFRYFNMRFHFFPKIAWKPIKSNISHFNLIQINWFWRKVMLARAHSARHHANRLMNGCFGHIYFVTNISDISIISLRSNFFKT